jgi:hypothetical protein
MGNGNCNKCKCNCENGDQNIKSDNSADKNLEIIKNDSYESFDNEINKLKLQTINNDNKSSQIPKNAENEKHTTNNNQEQITDNKKEKIEIENNYSINNNEKNDTANYININCNDKENKNEKDIIKQFKENTDEDRDSEKENIKIENNLHNVNVNNNYQKSESITAINEIKEKIKEKEEQSKINKMNKTRNNIEEFDIINNDLVYISNKNQNVDDNIGYNNYNKEYNNENIITNNNNIDNVDNKENYKTNDNYDNNNMNDNENKNLINLNGLVDIFSIIPKKKLLKLNENSIICNSKLEKIIKIPEKKKIVYSERFCVLTKKNFSYYKSKESYLKLNKPLLSISLKNILKVEQAILDDTSYYFGLICAINDETKQFLDKINTFINIEENNSEEFLLGFRSKNKDLIIKWIVILNYFVENYE